MTRSKTIIRQGIASDIPALLPLLQQLFAIEKDFTFDPQLQARGLHLLLDQPGAYIAVAETDGDVVGMATIQPHTSTARGGRIGIIEDVVIHPNHQSAGIGRALLNHLSSWARLRGYRALRLLADRSNSKAHGFYTHLGWETTSMEAWQTFM